MKEKPSLINALTIDIEDYFMVSAVEDKISKSDWVNFPSRVEANTRLVLDLLRQANVRGTFFTVGWVAEHHPTVVRMIVEQGHELGCHGYTHELVYRQSRDQFREDIRRSKQILEDVSGQKVQGYRAPSFSITKESFWAFEILEEIGFEYDSSLLPAAHARGGVRDGSISRFPHRRGTLAEFPMSTVRLFGKSFPFSGGGYFRLFPYSFTQWGFQSLNRAGQPGVIYLHPWEFDSHQPPLPLRTMDRFRHNVNIPQTTNKFRRLLKDFKFQPMRDVLKGLELLR
ncbi:MAG: hypothetical protein KCHDKBKB_01500 [Elusimicrobia bacterium]|nr:hypothetical protein [Elusimicrobiota bacterium]